MLMQPTRVLKVRHQLSGVLGPVSDRQDWNIYNKLIEDYRGGSENGHELMK